MYLQKQFGGIYITLKTVRFSVVFVCLLTQALLLLPSHFFAEASWIPQRPPGSQLWAKRGVPSACMSYLRPGSGACTLRAWDRQACQARQDIAEWEKQLGLPQPWPAQPLRPGTRTAVGSLLWSRAPDCRFGGAKSKEN